MIDRLRALLGDAAVRPARPGEAAHGMAAGAVVEPDGADACAALLGTCSTEGWTVEVAGGRTGGDRGRPVERVDVLLSTARLSGVAEYEPDDLTIGVAGGTTLAELRARVNANRQRVPLDPPSDRATVGGVLARAAAGPMRLAWSTPRRQTLGIELVTGDGRILRVGGRVVKNVAGYDLNKLVVGSAGTLGVITRAHLRLLPVPAAAATTTVESASVPTLAQTARALLGDSVQPAALELVGPPWRLIARYEGAAEAVQAGLSAVRAAAAETAVARDDGAIERLASVESDAALVLRLADLPDRLEQTIERAAALAAQDAVLAAHVADGIVRVLVPRASAGSVRAAELGAAIASARGSFGGTIAVERAGAELMRMVDPWGTLPEPVMRITRDLKRQFDPAGILQRGRWLA